MFRRLNGLRLSKFVKPIYAKAPIALLALAVLMTLGCGKRRAPQPPRERVLQRVEITGFQRGNQIVLSWRMPARNASKGSVLNISRADIYRLAEPQTSPLTLSEEEFASRSLLVASLSISDADFGLKPMTYTDTLQFAGQPARLRYALRFVNASGQKAGFSNFFLIEPEARVAAAPASLSAEISQEAVLLSWSAPTENVDGTTPPNIVGYNVYRSPSERQPAKLLNDKPVNRLSYRDEFFEFGTEYFYFVRSVSVGGGGEPVESRESNIIRILPSDVFPPTPPAAITLAASPRMISIFFAVNPEKDIAGYRIYRTEDPNLEKKDWTLLTQELMPINTFQDSRVESGKTYYYYITAVDKTGNVSEPSDVVSETVQ